MNKIFVSLTNPTEYTEKIKSVYAKVFGYTNYQRLVIIGHARTGSNFLLEALNTSSAIKMYHEIFAAHNRQYGEDFQKILATIYKKQPKSIKLVGFKLFYYHLTDQEWNEFLSYDNFMTIHLIRKNKLRTIISLDIAFKTNQWSARQKNQTSSSSKNISLDTSKLIQKLEKIEQHENLTKNRFQAKSFLEVSYEDLVSKPDQIFSQISSYLKIDDIDYKKNKLKKQNPEAIEDLVINYSEVVDLLKNTRFAHYLDP